MSMELVSAAYTSAGIKARFRATFTLNVRGSPLPSATDMRTGIMSALRPSQPAMHVLTSACITPTSRSGEPILKLTVCRG